MSRYYSNSQVNVYEPTQQLAVNITPAAIVYLKKQLQKQNAVGMYFGTKKSGCTGYAYVVDYVNSTDKLQDIDVISFDDLTIYIDKKSLPLIYGITIDCVRDGLNTVLRFINPNEKASCGCGESFTT